MIILKLGTLEIPLRAALDIDQTYEFIGGETTLRTISGDGIKQETWKKTRTTISGGGWIPPLLQSLDTTAAMLVACVAPQALLMDVGRQATLPAARRSDAGHTPWAVALLPDGGTRAASPVINGNVATAGQVIGDTIGYIVSYYPLLTCWVNRPVQSFSRGGASYRWEIVAEEV